VKILKIKMQKAKRQCKEQKGKRRMELASCSIVKGRAMSLAHVAGATGLCAIMVCIAGCMTPQKHREAADKAAYSIIKEGQKAAGKVEPFGIERPSDILRRRLLKEQNLLTTGAASLGTDELDPIKFWPEPDEPNTTGSSDARIAVVNGEAVKLTLLDALEVGARNSFTYQDEKEKVFAAALNLDLTRHDFGNRFASGLTALGRNNNNNTSGTTTNGAEYGSTTGWNRQLENGTQLSASFTASLANILTANHASSIGYEADASVRIPLLRGAGSHIAREPLTQAERNVLYAVWDFEKYKQDFVVDLASGYLGVLQQMNQVVNAEENYKGLITSTRRITRLAEAGTLPQIQVDQAVQDELSARNRWVLAQQDYLGTLDRFKASLGLPPDANIVLDREELTKLNAEYATSLLESETASDANAPVPPADAPVELRPAGATMAGRFEMSPEYAVKTAFGHRNDLFVAQGQVYDSQRLVIVAADQLRAEFTLLGTAKLGEGRSISSARDPDAQLRLDRAQYDALLTLDLPIDRLKERDNYRISLVNLEQAVRAQQKVEDGIKQDVRSRLRDLLDARESVQIQAKAAKLAEKRVRSTNLFLQAGRAQVRDILDAQASLLLAQNALTVAVVGYRVAELALQRDMGVLTVDEKGLWTEYKPGDPNATER
jgi:outer membrane protein TolC